MMSEAQEQCELIKWADSCVKTNIHPELAMLYAVPNGGRRDKAEAAHLKMQGVKAGVPDLCLAVPKGKYHRWLQNLSRCGYAVKVCYGSRSAKQAIEKYLKLGDCC